MPQVLPSTHNTPETAYVIEDYPFGRTLRCFKRMWVETAVKGAKKGLQRVVYQTTTKGVNVCKDEYESAPMDMAHAWNKPKAGTYGVIQIMFIDPDTGYIEIDGLGQYPWEEHVAKFQAKYGDDLDETQAARLPLEKAL